MSLSTRSATKRTFLRGVGVTVALATICGLAACSPGSEPEEAHAGDGAANLQIWFNGAAEQATLIQESIDRFSEANPQITVELLNIAGADYYTKLKTAAVGNQLPDVFFARTQEIPANAANKWQQSLEDYVSDADVEDFWPAEVAQMSYEGELYALPYDFSNFAVYVNKTMFADAGIELPTEDWTWEEFFDIAAEFPQTDGSRQTRWGAFVPFTPWLMMGILKANGGETFTEDGSRSVINSPENVETFRFLLEQAEKGVTPQPGALPQGMHPFNSGLVAMHVGGSWEASIHRNAIGDEFEWDVIKLPKGSSGERAVATAGGAWALSKDSESPEQAFELMRHLTSEDELNFLMSEQVSGIPGRQSSTERWREVAGNAGLPPQNISVFPDQMLEDAVKWSYPVYWDAFNTAWTNRVQSMTSGEDPAVALAALEEDVNAAAEKIK
ncbi:ABC transporter substrate-binding protein [Microbacterium immunditiarum]|uniref:ABC-type glycerol-3-phosphate transport system substrate-binding protein n=1 Tax=Microbacterium immunditiarum TaxID=337480 RepID=A0A7Y9GSC5_9MICO|nr:sugar ABC transporter substrate-binding protein [Microbacterium immunditiarum]NYE21597.1 ABC-type glycerol-3-phosphate transport system substrate-binding protein [Microbacterium immunditiarum]